LSKIAQQQFVVVSLQSKIRRV